MEALLARIAALELNAAAGQEREKVLEARVVAAESALPSSCVKADVLGMPLYPLQSPTCEKEDFFDETVGQCCVVPLSVSLKVPPGVVQAWRGPLELVGGRTRELFMESTFYRTAASVLPEFAAAVGDQSGAMNGKTLFTPCSLRTHGWAFNPDCKPQLHTRSKAGGRGEGQKKYGPAFNGELKSAGNYRALEQGAYYTAMDMVRVFFPASDDGREPSPHLFFSRPPIGYMVIGLGPLGILASLE